MYCLEPVSAIRIFSFDDSSPINANKDSKGFAIVLPHKYPLEVDASDTSLKSTEQFTLYNISFFTVSFMRELSFKKNKGAYLTELTNMKKKVATIKNRYLTFELILLNKLSNKKINKTKKSTAVLLLKTEKIAKNSKFKE